MLVYPSPFDYLIAYAIVFAAGVLPSETPAPVHRANSSGGYCECMTSHSSFRSTTKAHGCLNFCARRPVPRRALAPTLHPEQRTGAISVRSASRRKRNRATSHGASGACLCPFFPDRNRSTKMQNANYQTVVALEGDGPTFHDAELVGIEHRPADRELLLRFARFGGTTGIFRFVGVVSQRIVDFAEQNVVSRLLISPTYNFSATEVEQWSRWVDSRDDFQATVDRKLIDQRLADFVAGRKALFVLEPSCGAEVAVVCDSIFLGWAPEA